MSILVSAPLFAQAKSNAKMQLLRAIWRTDHARIIFVPAANLRRSFESVAYSVTRYVLPLAGRV
jgi:hypothetical protein